VSHHEAGSNEFNYSTDFSNAGKNMASLANPEAIEYFKNIKELNVIS